ncbi:sensor histidine kinase [Caulobacter hibisci]|uniref:histidine kinase n=1 Tax=Caulobacter hibisci TaxID=2035993 RepID=A0ABS0SX20_9CAUL|nr:HWE histidine kinase domain-containing protein [Caulobacter hibisci]MBI1684190.1 PAS domain-containing protein [Caulobacter hibisci]
MRRPAGRPVSTVQDQATQIDPSPFLLALQDGLNAHVSARAAVDFACAHLGRQLGVDSVGLVELEPDRFVGYVASEWLSGSLPSMRGRHAVDVYGPERLAALNRNEPMVVTDVGEVFARQTAVLSAFAEIGVAGFVETPLVFERTLRGWLYVSSTRPRRWSDQDLLLINETARRTWHAAERARAEERLREKEARLQAVLDQVPVGVILAAIPDGQLLLYNKASAAIMGHDMLGQVLPDYGSYGGVHPDGRPYAAEEYPTARAVLRRETIIDEPLRYRRPDGEMIDLSVSATAIDTPYDSYALCTFSDETSYLAALERARLLNGELSHRIKNLLATIQAISAQTFGTSPLRQTFENRLAALSDAHDLITSTGWSGGLAALVRTALEPFMASGRIAIEGCPVLLNDAQAVPFALALHELATNAAKYGALSAQGGQVDVSWTVQTAEQDRLVFCWRESGGPLVVAPKRRGFGSRMIERSLAGELKGEVTLAFEPTGVVCTIQALLPRPGQARS